MDILLKLHHLYLLLDILNEEYEPNLSEDFELESRKHENWNNS